MKTSACLAARRRPGAGRGVAPRRRAPSTMQDGRVIARRAGRDRRGRSSPSGRASDRRKIVNVERIPGGPMTLELTNVPERRRSTSCCARVSGYIAAPRAAVDAERVAFRSDHRHADQLAASGTVARRHRRRQRRSRVHAAAVRADQADDDDDARTTSRRRRTSQPLRSGPASTRSQQPPVSDLPAAAVPGASAGAPQPPPTTIRRRARRPSTASRRLAHRRVPCAAAAGVQRPGMISPRRRPTPSRR